MHNNDGFRNFFPLEIHEVQGPPTQIVNFYLAIRALRWCDRIGFLGFN